MDELLQEQQEVSILGGEVQGRSAKAVLLKRHTPPLARVSRVDYFEAFDYLALRMTSWRLTMDSV